MIHPEIREAMNRGLTGFNVPGFIGVSDVLLNVDTMDKTLSQRWMITLGAWRFRGVGNVQTIASWTIAGAIPTDGVVPSPDNQIESVLPDYNVILSWGSGGVGETAVIDYPTRGLTLAVTACSVRLQLQNTGLSAGNLPRGNFSGWLAPSDVGRDSVIQPPTLTSATRAINNPGAGGQIEFDVPARAVGYRPLLAPVTVYYGTGPNLYQLDNNGNRIKTDILNWASTGAPVTAPAVSLVSNAQPWIPLHPATQCIEVNTTSTTQQFIALQFVLDIS